MSLYIFGEIAGDVTNIGEYRQALNELTERLNITVSYDSLEKEDREEIDRALEVSGEVRIYYAIYSDQLDCDATALWIEARDLAMRLLRNEGIDPFILSPSDLKKISLPDSYYQGILESRLAGFIDGLKPISASAVVAVALVDGGIESIRKGSTDDCAREILKSLILPWDRSANTLYVFNQGTSALPSRGIDRVESE
jgi:hypothetical protein